MKKLTAILLALTVAVLLPACKETSDGEQSKINPLPESEFLYELTESGDAYRVVGVKNNNRTASSFEIPAEHGGLPVVEIGDRAFEHRARKFSSVGFPESIVRIGDYAFDARPELMFLYFSEGLKEIGEGAFRGCDLLTLELPESLTEIGEYAFDGNERLDAVRVPKNVTRIGEGCFASCRSLAEITVAEGNPSYLSSENCLIDLQTKTLLAACKSATIPSDGSVTKIGAGAFEGKEFPRAEIPEGVTEIGGNAFSDCENLRFLTLPESLKTVGNYAFGWCVSIVEITVPNGVTSLGDSVFVGDEKLETITLPASLTRIGDQLFDGCDSLTDVYFTGAEEQWEALCAGTDNSRLDFVRVHFGAAG